MTIKISQSIVDFGLKQPTNDAPVEEEKQLADVIQMHERLERPEMLVGSTYKLKTPLSEHALYVTINDIVLNQGTEHEQRRPFEIFINSKNMEHFQWIVALTRIISAVFRKGGDVTFLVEELHSVFDPKGGYFKRGGKYMPSLVAEIGDAIESHLLSIGLLKRDEPDEHQRRMMEEKRQQFESAAASAPAPAPAPALTTATATATATAPAPAAVTQAPLTTESVESDFPPGASLCDKCQTKASIMMDGCMTCLNCGYSKCG